MDDEHKDLLDALNQFKPVASLTWFDRLTPEQQVKVRKLKELYQDRKLPHQHTANVLHQFVRSAFEARVSHATFSMWLHGK